MTEQNDGQYPSASSPDSDSLPDLPTPFATGPLTPKLPAEGGGGCGKVALLGCGVFVVLFGIAMMVFMFKADDVVVWLFNKLEAEVVKGLPDDLPPADRERLESAFSGFYSALERGEVQPSDVQRLQGKLMEMAPDIEGGLSHEQIEELTLVLERAGGLQNETQKPEDARETPVSLPPTTVWFPLPEISPERLWA